MLTPLIFAACGCTISNPKHPVELGDAQVIPVLAPADGAPKNAAAITMTKPSFTSTNRELSQFYVAPLASLLIPVMIKHSYIVEQDPGVWFGNGLTAGLENAGYHVEHADTAKDAKTPVVIEADVSGLATKYQSGGLFKPQCVCTLDATVKIQHSGKQIFEQLFNGRGIQDGSCPDEKNLHEATEKALEDLLAKSTPDVARALAPVTRP